MSDLPTPFRLDGLRVLVTGASRGIGQAIETERGGKVAHDVGSLMFQPVRRSA